MKHILAFTVISIWLCLGVSSCSDKDEMDTYVQPGIYYIGMDISAIPDAITKGIESNNNFDMNYDPETIYLHSKPIEGETVSDYIEIPVYNDCPNNEGGTCKGFRYRMEVDENQNATIIPLDKDSQPYGTKTLSLKSGQDCYFSSWQEDIWKLNDNQVYENSLYGTPYTFYLRQKDVNKEIYRSKADLSIKDLTTNGDLTIVRACAGINVVGLFYDHDEMASKPGGGSVILTEEEFVEIMGSKPSTWYIKIYAGGDGFSNAYDLSSQQIIGDQPGGYYSTGDVGHFEGGYVDMNKYIPFSSRYFGYSSHGIDGYGYYTANGNHLFTPVKGGEPIEIYVLIKHWTGTGEEGPNDEWLLDDMGALQTKVNVTGGNPQPQNNCFYILGLLMDIKEFKAVWEANGGDNYSPSSTTRSLSGTPVREFKLENAKVICDVY